VGVWLRDLGRYSGKPEPLARIRSAEAPELAAAAAIFMLMAIIAAFADIEITKMRSPNTHLCNPEVKASGDDLGVGVSAPATKAFHVRPA
jgi:hypothetical protein